MPARRRTILLARRLPGSLAALGLLAVPVQAPPPPDQPPVLTLSGPTTIRYGSGPCNDFVIVDPGLYVANATDPDGTPPGAPPPMPSFSLGGDAVQGVDYEVGPRDAADQIEVSLLRREDGSPAQHTLVVTLQPGDGYVVGEPSTVTTTLIHLDDRCPPGTFVDVGTNRSQTIPVGAVPVPIQLVDPVNGTAFAALVEGNLPSGVSLLGDGTFVGAARSAGTFVTTIGSCRPGFLAPPGACTRQAFTVHVVGSSLPAPPAPCRVTSIGATVANIGSSSLAFTTDRAGTMIAFLGATSRTAPDGEEVAVNGAFLYDVGDRRLVRIEFPRPELLTIHGIDAIDVDASGQVVVVTAHDFGRNSRSLLVTGPDGVAREVAEVAGLHNVLLSRDGRVAYGTVWGLGEGPVVAIDVATGAVRNPAPTLGAAVQVADISPDGARILVLTNRGYDSAVVDVASGEVQRLSGYAQRFSLDGTGVIRPNADGSAAERVDLATGTVNQLLPYPAVASLIVEGRYDTSLAHAVTAPDGVDLFLRRSTGEVVQVTDTDGFGILRPRAVTEDGDLVAFVAAGSLDDAGRGSLTASRFLRVHVARCDEPAMVVAPSEIPRALARTG